MEFQNVLQLKHSFIKNLSENKNLLILFSFLSASVILAPELIYLKPISSFFDFFVNVSLSVRKSDNFIYVFLFSLAMHIIPIIISYISGLSVCGQTYSVITVILFGLFIGGFSSIFYSNYGTSGLLCCLALYYLPIITTSFALLLASRESFVFSMMIVKAFSIKHEPMNFSSDFKVYSLRFVFMSIIIVFSAVISAVLNTLFLSMFAFL